MPSMRCIRRSQPSRLPASSNPLKSRVPPPTSLRLPSRHGLILTLKFFIRAAAEAKCNVSSVICGSSGLLDRTKPKSYPETGRRTWIMSANN